MAIYSCLYFSCCGVRVLAPVNVYDVSNCNVLQQNVIACWINRDFIVVSFGALTRRVSNMIALPPAAFMLIQERDWR